jgi:hypothetical protein
MNLIVTAVDFTGKTLVGLGALAAGIGSLLSGVAALILARRRGREEAEHEISTDREISRHTDTLT